jgi:large conductance mechanosensitive channel
LVPLCPSGAGKACAAEKVQQPPSVAVRVDPRVELMSIIFRLAGNPEYNQGRVEQYTKDVESHFGQFREHRTVELARGLRRKRGVSFDACMSMAVHLKDAYDLAVGVIIGAAFGKIIDSLVKHLIMPLIGVMMPGEQGYLGWKWVINGKEIPYGLFLGEIVNFLIVALALYIFIVKFLGLLMKAKKEEAAAPPSRTKD